MSLKSYNVEVHFTLYYVIFLVDSDMLLPLRTMILDIHTMELGTWKNSDGDFISSSIKLGYVISMTFL